MGENKDRSLESRCFTMIFNSLVDYRTGRMWAHDDFRHVLEPYAREPAPPYNPRDYPMTNIGLLARVTENRQLAWMNIPLITRYLDRGALRECFNIMAQRRGQHYSFVDKVDFVRNVVAAIGTLSYTPEWRNSGAIHQIDDVISDATDDVPLNANEVIASTFGEKIIRHFRDGPKRTLRIMDVGTGSGNTIIEIIDLMGLLAHGKSEWLELKEKRLGRPLTEEETEKTIIEKYPGAFEGLGVDRLDKLKIDPDYYKYVRLYIVDVSEPALDTSFARIAKLEPGFLENTPGGGIVKVHSNFFQLRDNPVISSIMNNPGSRLDAIVSGAALCHQTQFEPFFRLMSDLLFDDGIMHIWDWYNGPSFAAPYLRLTDDPEGRSRTVFYITGRDGQVYPKYVPDDRPLSFEEKAALYDRLASARDVRVVYEMNPDEKKHVEVNFQTWLGFLGYVDKEQKQVSLVDSLPVDVCLEGVFDDCIHTEGGMHYFRFLERLQNVERVGPMTFYNVLEGTGIKYIDVMQKRDLHGVRPFDVVTDSSLIQLHRDLRDRDELTISGLESACNVWCTLAKKRASYGGFTYHI